MADAIQESTVPTVNAAQVAAMLPATAPAPEPARRVSFWKGLLFFWIAPGRLGPHLAVGSWKAALAAHAISVVFALSVAGYIAMMEFAGSAGYSRAFEGVREGLAFCVLSAAMATSMTGMNWVVPLLMIAIVPAAEFALVLEAVLVMPWCAGGDSAWSVFKRSLRNVYWSSTILIPGSLFWLVGYWTINSHLEPGLLKLSEILLLVGIVAAVLFTLFLALRMLIVGAKQYVGDPVGPAFSPREPLCDQCGYRITALPLTGRCPECGLPVGDSLPGGRRQRTIWEQYEFHPRGFRELVRMQWRIIRQPSFFETLPVQAGHSAARHFWWGTFLLIVLGSLVLTQIMQWILQAMMGARSFGMYEQGEGATALLVAICLPFAAQAIMLFVACLWAQFRCGIRDYRVSATVCYHASPFIWPLMLIVLISAFVFTGAVYEMVEGLFRVSFLGIRLTGADVLAIIMALLAAGSLLYWWLRLCRALRAVRYANV